MKTSPKDKQKVLEWMRNYCHGFRKARNKEEIVPWIQQTIPHMSERYFRAIISELKHEGEVGALSSIGYWSIPAVCINDDEEKQMALNSVREMKSRALNMLEDASRLEKRFIESGVQLTMGI